MDIKSTGELIAEERKKSDITQKQLGNMLGVTDMAVSKWERGLCYPDVTLLPQLADILGLTVTEIIQGRRNESPKAANTEEPSQGEKEEIKEPVSEITAEEATREVVEIASKQIKRHKKNTKKLAISLSSAVAAVLIAVVVCLICLLPKKDYEAPAIKYGDFYTVNEIYEQGLLTEDDLQNIEYYASKSIRAISERELENLTEENAAKMKECYAELLRTKYGIAEAQASEVVIKKCYGTTVHESNNHIFVIFGGYSVVREEEDEGVVYANGNDRIYVWRYDGIKWRAKRNVGELYTLEEIKELYTGDSDVDRFLRVLSNIIFIHNETARFENFTPIEITPLDNATENKIKNCAAYGLHDTKVSDVIIKEYYGVYNGYIAVDLDYKNLGSADEFNIDRNYFRSIKLWKENEIIKGE